MARAQATPRKIQASVFIGIGLAVTFGILAIADVGMIPKSGAEKCPAQFPKWIGCVLANHETLSGALIGATGALLAAWFAWHAVMTQIELARNADRPIVHGGRGWRTRDQNNRDIGMIFTGQNTGKTPARSQNGPPSAKTGPTLRTQNTESGTKYCRLT
jgi:hypothetical protein